MLRLTVPPGVRHTLLAVLAAVGPGCTDLGEPLTSPEPDPDPGKPPDPVTIALRPVRDGTLYEPPSTGERRSNGRGVHFFVGRTSPNAEEKIRRGVVRFDVAGAVPAGATIESAELEMVLTAASEPVLAADVTLHAATRDWGEGASDADLPGGLGVDPEADDVTWDHARFPGELWASAGGDFEAAPSATVEVVNRGTYTWPTGPGIVADVAAWLADPGSNHGWFVLGDESTPRSAKRFESREAASGGPVLRVTYRPASF